MGEISFDVMRVGKKYCLTNFGDVYDFVRVEIGANGEMKLTDIANAI